MLKADLAAAGIPYEVEGPHGPLFADFHALRHSFITMMERAGISPKTAQELARHSDIRLTMQRYTHKTLHDLAAAVETLPVLTKPDARRQAAALQATGTDGDASRGCTNGSTKVAPTADNKRDGLRVADAREGEEAVAVGAGVRWGLIASETKRDGLREVNALGLEPRTYGLKVRCSTS
jgi:hypothetical protein